MKASLCFASFSYHIFPLLPMAMPEERRLSQHTAQTAHAAAVLLLRVSWRRKDGSRDRPHLLRELYPRQLQAKSGSEDEVKKKERWRKVKNGQEEDGKERRDWREKGREDARWNAM